MWCMLWQLCFTILQMNISIKFNIFDVREKTLDNQWRNPLSLHYETNEKHNYDPGIY